VIELAFRLVQNPVLTDQLEKYIQKLLTLQYITQHQKID